MKQRLCAFLAFIILVCSLTGYVLAEGVPETYSEAYVVMDAVTGQVLLEKDSHRQMYPASITKILTAAIALRDGDPQDEWTMSYKATHTLELGSTNIWLTEGETVPVDMLLKATMIESANDAANGLAEYVAGDIDDFPAIMNETARSVGALDSHFVNANGLPDPDHYTTAYDMAVITRWALTVPGFRELFGAEEWLRLATNKSKNTEDLHYGTRNHMLVESKYYYEGTEGGKLGWTDEAQHTLVELVKRGDMEIIVVVMKSSGSQWYKYMDTIALCDYCFDHFGVSTFSGAFFEHDPIPVLKDGVQVGTVTVSSDDVSVNHPSTVAKADIICFADLPEYYLEGSPIEPTAVFTDRAGSVIAQVPLKYTYTGAKEEEEPAEKAEKKRHGIAAVFLVILQIIKWILIILLILLAVFTAIVFAVRAYNLRRRRLRREARQARRMRDRSDRPH